MVSNLVSILMTVIATSVFLPKLARMDLRKKNWLKLMALQSAINISVVTLLAVWMFFFGDFTVSIISDKSFDDALMFYFQILIGDILRCLTITLSFFFLSQKLPLFFTAPDIVYGVSVVCILLCFQSLPSESILLITHTAGASFALLGALIMTFQVFRRMRVAKLG